MGATPARFAWQLCWSVVLAAAGVTSHAVERGESAPSLTLPVLANPPAHIVTEGTQIPLLSLTDLRGKVVYVDFWDSACAPCRKSLPALSELRDKYARSDVEFLAVNLDPNPADALKFLATTPVSYPVISDPSAASADRWGLKGLPTAFLIDRQGRVSGIHQGFDTPDITTIENKLTALIAAQDKG